MSQQNRTKLKNYFSTGNRPTQEQFADLIDSSFNLADNDLFETGGNLGLGREQPQAKLSVNGSLNISPNNELPPAHGLFVHGNVGIGDEFASPTAQLAVNGGVYIGDNVYRDPGQGNLRVDGAILAGGNVTLDNDRYVATDKVRALDDSGLKLSEAGGNGLTIRHSSGDIETDSSLKIAGGSSLITHKVEARDNSGLSLCEDGGKGLHVLDSSGDVSADGNLTLADSKYLATDKVQARDAGGLHLFEANGRGLSIANNSGDLSVGGHINLANDKHLQTDQVRARDESGLKLSKVDGSTALMVHNNGHVSIGNENSRWAEVNVTGSVLASSSLEAQTLRLNGDINTTLFHGYTTGRNEGEWTIDVPERKVVCGIRFQRWRSGSSDKDCYSFALRYK